MTYQSHVFTRKPLYIALALATLAMGNAPTAAFATQPAAAAATPAAQRAENLLLDEADENDDDEMNDMLWRAIRKDAPPPPVRSIFGR